MNPKSNMALARALHICFLACKMQLVVSTLLLSPCCFKSHKSLGKLAVDSEILCWWEIVKNREAWRTAVRGSQRVGHGWATEQQQGSSSINSTLLFIFTAPRRGCTDILYVFPGRVTPGQLMSYIQLFKNNLKSLGNHCGLLQLGLATVQTLKHPQTAKWDNFLAFERLLLQVCCSGSFLGY